MDILKMFITKKELMQNNFQDLETTIYAKYQEAATNIPVQKDNVRKHSQEMTTALDKQG